MIAPAILSVVPLMALAMILRGLGGWNTLGDKRFAAALAGGGLGAAGFAILIMRSILSPALATQQSPALTAAVSIVIAPPVEECLKGVVLLMIAATCSWEERRTGLIVGAITGLAFAMTENLHFFVRAGDHFATNASTSDGLFSVIPGGLLSRELALYVLERLCFVSIMHGMTGSWMGAALTGNSYRTALPRVIGAFGAAVVLHAGWNIAGWLALSMPFVKHFGGIVIYAFVAGTAVFYVLSPRHGQAPVA